MSQMIFHLRIFIHDKKHWVGVYTNLWDLADAIFTAYTESRADVIEVSTSILGRVARLKTRDRWDRPTFPGDPLLVGGWYDFDPSYVVYDRLAIRFKEYFEEE